MAEIELVELGADAPTPAPQADTPTNVRFCQVVYNVFKKFWQKNMAAKVLLCLLALTILVNPQLTFVILRPFGVPLWNEHIKISPNKLEVDGKMDLDKLVTHGGKITGFPNKILEMCSDSDLLISVGSKAPQQSAIFLGENFINITGVDTFKILNKKKTAQDMFFHGQPKLTIPKSVTFLKVKGVTTTNLTGEPNQGIAFKSSKDITFRADTGTNFLSRNTVLKSAGDITLKSTHGAIILDGTGFHLNAVEVPTLTEFEYQQNGQTYALSQVEKNVDTFRLCIYIPNGRIFLLRIPANISSIVGRWRCHHAKNAPY